MQINLAEIVTKITAIYFPFLFALCFHEFAHGWVARKRGDNTAMMMGRLTMNPMAHMDILGTLILPLMAILTPGFGLFFGWAKPVPVNERNLKNPRKDMFWIALAGPASNILLAALASLVLFLLSQLFLTEETFVHARKFIFQFMSINIVLAIFNAVPLHPLDGGKILARFLSPSVNYKLEQNEHISGLILLALIFLFHKQFWAVLSVPVGFLHQLLLFWA